MRSTGSAGTPAQTFLGTRPRRQASFSVTDRHVRALLIVLAEIRPASTSLTISAIHRRTAASSRRAIGTSPNAGSSRFRPCDSRSAIEPFVR